MQTRILVLLSLVIVGGCSNEVAPAPTPVDTRDPITYCDACSVDFRAPACQQVTDGMGTRTVCPAPDGTEWSWTPVGYSNTYQRYDAIPGTHLALHNWCMCADEFCAATFGSK